MNMSIIEKDYKQSLFLPQTNFPMRANLPERREWVAIKMGKNRSL